MRFLPRHPAHSSPPPAVLALLAFEAVVVLVLLVLGVSWLALLASAAPAITLTLALLNPTVQELGRRQPKLSVTTRDGDRMLVPAARPWPIDAERIVANEVADARETAKRRRAPFESFMRLQEPFALRPSEADHEQAQEDFEGEVAHFAEELREWLNEYVVAVSVYANTFEVAVVLRNAASGAYAEAVSLVLELPEGLEVADGRPDLSMPPERPVYEPPRPRSFASLAPVSPIQTRIHDLARAIVNPVKIPWHETTWTLSEDGRHLETRSGDIHPDRSVTIGERVFLRALGPGAHVIRWTTYTKSARRPVGGTFILEVPPDPPRPAFGRLDGLMSYPDIPLIGGDGEVERNPRSSDPPARPKPSDEGDDVFGSLREANAFLRWRTLGLDPADDGPDRSTVSEAKRAD